MKKHILIILTLLIAVASAGQTKEEYNEKYQRLAGRLGLAGVGIETHLDKWEAAFPDDPRLLEARAQYYLAKGLSSQVVPKPKNKFLGNKPVLSLPDSTGNPVNYFEEHFYDDELFGQAMKYIDRAIDLNPDDLFFRVDKIVALLDYEKESPDMAVQEMDKLVEFEKQSHPEWTALGDPVGEDGFSDVMSTFCVRLYNIANDKGYEAFFNLSTKLSKLYPKNSNYLDNIGSYWLVAKGKDKKAMSFYKKALKLNPDDEVAKANIKIIEKKKAKK